MALERGWRSARPMPLARICCLTVAIAVTIPVPPAVAQSATTPVNASIAVRRAANRPAYHLGEQIALRLEFRGTGDPDYYFSTAACDLFGRLGSAESVAVTPARQTDDPLEEFIASSGGIAGSCISGWHPVDGTPLVIRVTLNDRIRFNRPGTYTLVVSSTRLQRYSARTAPVLTSAPFELTIGPMDDGWAMAEVARASGLIDGGNGSDVSQGAAILRYLGTEAAALALIDRYDAIARVSSDHLVKGVISSAHRDLIIQRMEARVDEGEGLDASFLTTLTRLRVLRDLPLTAADHDRRREQTTKVQAEYDARWRAATARIPVSAVTLGAELVRLQTNPSAELRRQIAADLEQHSAEAVEAFLALPPHTQAGLLQSADIWADLDRSWMLPALRQLYAAWRGSATQNDTSGLGDVALRRLYGMAPDEGRQLIVQEIQTGAHRIRYDALAILPDAQLSALDSALQGRYSSAPAIGLEALVEQGTTAWLMARYASANLRPFVTERLAGPLPGCIVEAGLIAYLLKHEPVAALQRLDPGRDRSPGTGCVIPPLFQLAARYWDARLESAVIEQLAATDVSRVADAAQVLGLRGSIGAKRPLIERLAQWSAEWHGRAAEWMDAGPGAPALTSPRRIENSLSNALFQNQQFRLTGEDVSTIRRLCITDDCRTNVDVRAHVLR